MKGEIVRKIDLAGVLCPMNFVKIKLALEEIEEGELLEAILDDGEPIINVPRSLKEEGHRVVKVEPIGERFRVVIERGEG